MKISVIIPVVNEQARIRQAIDRAWAAGADEVIVVDGQSSDNTASEAQKSNCSFFLTTPGRATQQNHGAKQARGAVVLFLHVDTWLVEDACSQIRECLSDPLIEAGAFQQQIESSRRLLKWIEKGNANRVRLFNLAYGDQGIFVRKSVFDEVGGFPKIPLMEDYALSQRLRKRSKLALLPGPLYVDARRWHENGPLLQTIRNWLITLAFRMGVSPKRLARFYSRHDRCNEK